MKLKSLLLLALLCVSQASEARAQYGDTWVTAETLFWWVKDSPGSVPLATVAPATSPALSPGALGNPDTTVVLGGADIDYGLQFGGRFTIGRWLTDDPELGLEGNFLFLGRQSEIRSVADQGTLFLTNPFFDAAPGVQSQIANYLTIPGPQNRGFAQLSNSHELYGAELNALCALPEGDSHIWHLLVGYRFFNVNEDLTFVTSQQDDVNFFPGQFVNTFDQFETKNYFHGGQVGLRCRWTRGPWSLGSTVKVAMGNSHQVLNVRGTSTTNTGLNYLSQIPVTTVAGGIYAQPTNIGQYERDRFAVLPEVSLQLGLQLTSHVRTFAGYTFMYMSSVARPGNQVDGTINSTQLVSFTGVPTGPLNGEPRPAPIFHSTDYWTQGINVGIEFMW